MIAKSQIINFDRITPCGECCDGCKKKDEAYAKAALE
jgi:hypothetical protein